MYTQISPSFGRALQEVARDHQAAKRSGALGPNQRPLPQRCELTLFELIVPIRMPADASEGNVPLSEDAVRIDYTPGESPSYGLAIPEDQQTIFFPAYRRALVANVSTPVGMPPFAPGDRVYCWYNVVAKHWEAIEPAMRVCRFEMTASLPYGHYAAAIPYWYDDESTRVDGDPITVYDMQEKYSKMPTASGDVGALGIAQWMPDRNRWEIVDMQTPGDFWGTLDGDLHLWDGSQTVTVKDDGVLGGYDVFQTSFGDSLVAYNTSMDELGGRMFSGREGNNVLCRWSIKQALYYIAAVHPSDLDWQTLDVVTRTSLSINFSAQSFVHRHYTRQIKLPPWTQVGPEIERW
jgi:hypothetical protein